MICENVLLRFAQTAPPPQRVVFRTISLITADPSDQLHIKRKSVWQYSCKMFWRYDNF